jgi:crossover junction endodeoxyribonuclease RuvC
VRAGPEPRVRILGLDPGSLRTGYGLVEKDGARLLLLEAGLLPCPRTAPLPERLARLAGGLAELVARAAPETVVLETPFHHRVHGNSRSLIVLAQARGALLSVVGGRGLEVREYSPAEVKSAVTGDGRAGKHQVARMVRLLLALDGDLGADAADAVAVAICAAKRLRADRLSALHVGRK